MNADSLSDRVNFAVGLTVLTLGYVGTLVGLKLLFGL
jgi:hypothetical protein